MKTFAVDDDLVALVWEQARPAPFEHLSFSDALRRILKRESQKVGASRAIRPAAHVDMPSAEELLAELDAAPIASGESRSRAPKADLRELVRLQVLKDGQELIFVDYKGPQPTQKATIADGELVYQGRRYSMSALSSRLLKQEGHRADHVRGPEHWATEDGRKVRELWEYVLSQRGEK